MRPMTKAGLLVLLVTAVLIIAGPQSALALGTPVNTPIDNLATVNYSVQGVAQTPIESAPGLGNSVPGAGLGIPTTFLVDKKIDLTVAQQDGAAILVMAGATGQILTFTVTNTGNATQDFSLQALPLAGEVDPFGGPDPDNFDANNVQAFVDMNGNSQYDVGVDLTYIDELAPDASQTVYITADIPGGQILNDVAVYALVATAARGGGGGLGLPESENSGDPDDPTNAAGPDVVFGDGAGIDDAAEDGQHSDRSAYKVTSVVLTVAKTAAVISDPFSGVINPKAIPGAIVRYTITVENPVTSVLDATDVTITDVVPADLTYFPASIGGGDSNDDSDPAGGGLTWTVNTLAIGQTATLIFEATVN